MVVFFSNKADRHIITEMLLKVALSAVSETKPEKGKKIQPFSHISDCVLSLFTVYLHNNTIKKSVKISQWQSEAVNRRIDNAMATNKGADIQTNDL